jgi:signal peptidase I
MGKGFSLKKSKKILLQTYHHFLKRKKRLSLAQQEEVKSSLLGLQDAVLQKKRGEASNKAKALHELAHTHLKKNIFEKTRDFIVGIGVALIIAVIVRQMWFELYEIPTGSMRPTFKEQDRLAVSKTDFGINVPLTTKHFYFDPNLVQRNGIVIFTVEDMDFRDGDTVYFYIFPGKKLLVKRLIGKPGDTLYFYGGKIYGIDEQGNDISPELQLQQLDKIEHIPVFTFDGRVTTTPSPIQGIYSPVIVYHMNEPIARLYATSSTQAKGELLPKILTQDPNIHYRNLWGFENFAMARLLTKDQVKQLTDIDPATLDEGVLYLELKHHPSLSHAKMGYDEWNRYRPMVGTSTSIIPLQEHHLRAIFENIYTARFIVKEGMARRSSVNLVHPGTSGFFPLLPGVPDGTYEFYYGKAHQIKWEGISFELPPSHPLYKFDPQRIQLFYNIGLEFDTRFSPQTKEQIIAPPRYAYFRNGDLYLTGAPVLKSDDPTLLAFIEKEKQKQAASRPQNPYYAFVDIGPPLLPDGRVNADIIRRYGLKVPPESYLVLGDNHANSGDSREFGFVPEGNLRGGPTFIFWPPGSRWGIPNQPPYAFFNIGRVIVWILAGISIGGWYIYHRRRNRLPLKFD